MTKFRKSAKESGKNIRRWNGCVIYVTIVMAPLREDEQPLVTRALDEPSEENVPSDFLKFNEDLSTEYVLITVNFSVHGFA